jgi:GNAT superfamily N-acetyltransferase
MSALMAHSFQATKLPNKAPEPTPTAVTPRAIEMKFERSNWIVEPNEARGAPAAVVAHLWRWAKSLQRGMTYQLDIENDSAAIPDAVRSGIREADPIDVRPRDWQALSLALRDSQGTIVGGLYGNTLWSWLRIEGLWVDQKLRGKGLGKRLLVEGEEIAIQRGCIGSCLGTFDFQARGFYERHGYSSFATLRDFPPGHSYYQLLKHFAVRTWAKKAQQGARANAHSCHAACNGNGDRNEAMDL